jgi:hypothetical protein
MWRSIRESGFVCQGRSRHIILRTGGLGWTKASQAGVVRCERKGVQARELLRGGVLRRKGAKTSLQATCRFPGLWQEVRRVYGVAQERAITDPIVLWERELACSDLPK